MPPNDLATRMWRFANELEAPLICREPAYGTPGFDHCAACCNATGFVVTCAEDQAVLDAATALRKAARAVSGDEGDSQT